jgi:hypothetical protein
VVVTSRSANLKDAVKIAINQANSRFAPDSVHDGMPVATSDDVLDKMSGEMKPIVADSISNNTSRNAIFCNVPGPWLIREFLAVDLGFIHDLAIEMQKRDLASEILECNPMIEMLRNSEDQSSSVEHLLPDIKSIGVTPANEDKKVSLLVNAKYNERKRSIISEISETKGTFETSSMGMIIPNPQSAPSSSGPVQQMPFMGGSNYSSISTPASRYFPTSQLVPFSSRHKYESPKVKNRNLLEIINRNLLKAKNRKLPEIINHKLLKVKNRNLPEIINRNLPEITNHKLPKVKNRNLLKVKKLSLTPTPSPFAINIAAIDVSKQSPSSVLPQNVQVPVHAREVYCANAPTSITCECLSFNNGTTARIVIREFLIIENNLKEHNTLHDNYCNDNNKVKFPFSPNGYITYNATGKYKKEYTFLTDDPFNAHSNIFFPDIKGWADENLGESLASPHSQKALFQIYLYSYYIWPPKK